MSEEELITDGKKMNRLERHRFMMLIGGTIVISLFLVAVALALYASSGAAQLDLSRPGYKSVRDQAVHSDSLTRFPASGTIDEKTLDEFRSLYDKQAEKATNVDSFSDGAMSDKALSIDDVPTAKE